MTDLLCYRSFFRCKDNTLSSTRGFGITYQRGTTTVGISLEVFADADYASKATDRRSVSGGAIMSASACVCVGFLGPRNV